MTVKRTRLCYWIAGLAKPGAQSSNISRVCFTVISHTPVRSGFYHIHIVDRRNCNGSCLLNLTQQSCIFFNFAICSIALLNLGETCHLKGRGMVTVWLVHGAVAMLLRLWKHAATLWHQAAWIRIVTSHNAWMGYEYSLPKHESPKGDS